MTKTLKILKAKSLTDIGINHGFSERVGGVSPAPTKSLNLKVSPLVPDDIKNVASNIGMILQKNSQYFSGGVLLYLEGQAEVTLVEKCDGFKTLYGFDGAVTNQTNCTLAITVADCLPILLADKKSGIIGISHAGWKGSAGKITTKVIEQMVSIGASKKDIVAVIGPGICKKCYEVDKEVADEFSPNLSTVSRDNKYFLDLVKANIDELRNSGITSVENLDICTFENTDRFFSARKEGQTGRFLAYISRKST